MLNLVPASDTQEKILMHGYKFVQKRELILVKKNLEINVEDIAMVKLETVDVVRHRLVRDIIEAYERDGEQR